MNLHTLSCLHHKVIEIIIDLQRFHVFLYILNWRRLSIIQMDILFLDLFEINLGNICVVFNAVQLIFFLQKLQINNLQYWCMQAF